MYWVRLIIAFNIVRNGLSAEISSKFCDSSPNFIDSLIKDLYALDSNRSYYEDIRTFCERRNKLLNIDLPIAISLQRFNQTWIVAFNYESYSGKVFSEHETSKIKEKNTTAVDRLWFLFKITRFPFDCGICRMGIYLTFNNTNVTGKYNLKYGFQRTLFPLYINYTRAESVKREDKSNYSSINSELMNYNITDNDDFLKKVFIDDNFFGNRDQHFLVGIASSNSLNSSLNNRTETSFFNTFVDLIPFLKKNTRPLSIFDSYEHSLVYPLDIDPLSDADKGFQSNQLFQEFAKFEKAPLVTYAFCYTHDKSLQKYRPSFLCYPYVHDGGSECICWEQSNWKLYLFIAFLLCLGCLALFCVFKHRLSPPSINKYDISSAPAPLQSCTSNMKTQVSCGFLSKKSFPGILDLDFKHLDGSSICDLRISSEMKWSSIHLVTHDTSDLIINYKSNEALAKPRYCEVTFYRNNEVPRDTLVYLYGITIETQAWKEIFPYCHYLDHRRTVRLSNSEEWKRGLRRVNMTTHLPVTLQKTQSLTMLERLCIFLVMTKLLATKLLLSLNQSEETAMVAFIEGISSITIIFIILILYIHVLKRHNSDRYDVIPISYNYRLYTIFAGIFLVFIIYDTINFLPTIGGFIWKGNKFDHQIAAKFAEISHEKDLKWTAAFAVAIVICAILMFAVEQAIFYVSRPRKKGPLSFDIGYDARNDLRTAIFQDPS